MQFSCVDDCKHVNIKILCLETAVSTPESKSVWQIYKDKAGLSGNIQFVLFSCLYFVFI